MTLFEFEDGRLLPAQFGHAVPDDVSDELLQSIRDNISEVLERPLFPVVWDTAVTAAGLAVPWLLALDASGMAVNVEVCSRLTAEGLVSALSRSAEVVSLGWNDLAALYTEGPAAFRTRWAEFRGGLPPKPETGPQLTIVAASVDGGVRPSLDFLGRVGIEVLKLEVREMSSGRRFVEVRPLDPAFPLGANLILGGRRAAQLANGVERGAEEPDFSDRLLMPDVAAGAPEGAPVREEAEPVSEEVPFSGEEAAPAFGEASLEGEVEETAPQVAEWGTQRAAQWATEAAVPVAEGGSVAPQSEPVEGGFQDGAEERIDNAWRGDEALGNVSAAQAFAEADTATFAPIEVVEAAPAPQAAGGVPGSEAAALPAFMQGFKGAVVEETVPGPAGLAGPEGVPGGDSLGRRGRRASAPAAGSAEQAGVPAAALAELTPQELAEAAILEAIVKEAGAGVSLYWVVPARDLPSAPAGVLVPGGIDVEGTVWPTPVLAAPEVGAELDAWDCWRIGNQRGPSLTDARAEITARPVRKGHGRRAL
ncbi:MAG: hypothetical protein Q3999_03685 [Buchananella hordeovulneris]|nr:hypothetical protein [Buchananella hordeovulneris]